MRSLGKIILTEKEISTLLSLFPKGVVAVDLETTGLSPLVDKIIEIAAVKITALGEVETFHSLINPLIEIPEKTIQYHGLKNQDLIFAPTIKKPLKKFWDFSGPLPLLAHNAIFDLGHLIKSSHDFQIPYPHVDIFDSCKMARSALKKKEQRPSNFKLSTLSSFYQFKLQHHLAMEDSLASLKITANIFLEEENLKRQQLQKEKSFLFNLSQFQQNSFVLPLKFKDLKIHIENEDLLQIVYKGSKSGEMKRSLRPISLMPLPSGAVLYGECLHSKMNKSFILKRIKTFQKLEASKWSVSKMTLKT